MNVRSTDIQNYFLSAGGEWRPVFTTGDEILNPQQPVPSVFINAYACCGVVAADDTVQVENSWKTWEQTLIRAHRAIRRDERGTADSARRELEAGELFDDVETKKGNGHQRIARDLFLVMIVDRIPFNEMFMLSTIVNDTFGSRKILLACDNRPIADTLGDLAFFSAREQIEHIPDREYNFGQPPRDALDAMILHDLSCRSASVIFDRLVDGKYPPSPLIL